MRNPTHQESGADPHVAGSESNHVSTVNKLGQDIHIEVIAQMNDNIPRLSPVELKEALAQDEANRILVVDVRDGDFRGGNILKAP